MEYYSHHESNPDRPLTPTDVVRKIVFPPLTIFATIVDIIFIVIIVRYRLLLRDNTFIILVNLTAVMIYPRMLDIIDDFYAINDCYLFYVTRAASYFKFVLLTLLLVKSSVNLLYPNYKLKERQLFISLGILNILLVSCITYGFIRRNCNMFSSFSISNVNISVYICFVVLAICYNIVYLTKKGLEGFFRVRKIEFLIINLNVSLFVLRASFYIVFSLTFIPLIVLYLFGLIYVFEPVYYFLIVYRFSEDFKSCCKQFFARKKLGGRVAFDSENANVMNPDHSNTEV